MTKVNNKELHLNSYAVYSVYLLKEIVCKSYGFELGCQTLGKNIKGFNNVQIVVAIK